MIREVDYDDIMLLPKISEINSRDAVLLTSEFKGIKTGKEFYPIFSSPMKEISGKDLVIACSNTGVLGILHRFSSIDYRVKTFEELGKMPDIEFGVSIGLGELNMALLAQNVGASIICVDIANGYISNLPIFIKLLRDTGITIPIMTGNVVTYQGARALVKSGANYIRIGIGSGKLCTTRDVTAIGRPQLSALLDCSSVKYIDDPNSRIVSDGGISISGRAVKSFVYGADFVMLGSMLAYAEEAENDGLIYGMASRKLQQDMYGAVKSVEGKSMIIDNQRKRPCAEIIQEFTDGIRSACTYLNAKSYSDLSDESIEIVYLKGYHE